MLDFFKYAEMLFNALIELGDFLLEPRYILQSGPNDLLIAVLDRAGFEDIAQTLYDWYYTPYSYAAILFGAGIAVFLIIRFIKFFTDAVGL